ncbi:MAG: rod-binding protein [Alphaproteobacteria bacterium]|nr:rod-binding protein [Alphaproteobacteria bacterium]
MDALKSPVDPSLLALNRKTEPKPAATRDAVAARRAAEDFESFFIAQMVGTMFANLKTDGPFGGGFGETIYRSMLADEYGKVMSRRGGVGIADAVEREILKLQEVQMDEHDRTN